MALLPNYLFFLSSIFLVLVIVVVQFCSCHCLSPNKHVNVTNNVCHRGGGHHRRHFNWFPAKATWYGSPTGAGSNGGSCGYSNTVERRPFSGMVASGGSSIYQNGYGCGVCYEVRCLRNKACSRKPVTVTIIDECPGCVSNATHFDLSGTAFGAMAKPGLAQRLRNVGVLQVQYKNFTRALVEFLEQHYPISTHHEEGTAIYHIWGVRCNYRRVAVAVRVDPGSNPTYFTCLIEYEDGFGIESVMLKQPFGRWLRLQKTWGASWVFNNYGKALRPYSLRLVEAQSRSILTLNNVIPENWKAGRTYRSLLNFKN